MNNEYFEMRTEIIKQKGCMNIPWNIDCGLNTLIIKP